MATRAVIPGGIYKHYKGGLYRVICIARMEATLEELVIYKTINRTPEQHWARPKSVFTETLEVDKKIVHRFSWIN